MHMELAKCLQLVVPASMTADDRAGWIAAAADALEDIRANEVAEVSAEVRRTVTRVAQIVPEIARLVAERRSRRSRMRDLTAPVIEGPRLRKHILDRNRSTFVEADWAELSQCLERMGSPYRYGPDGRKYDGGRLVEA